MDMQSHLNNFSLVYYTMLLLCSSSVLNSMLYLCFEQLWSHLFLCTHGFLFLLQLSFLMILTHPFQTCRLIPCCCFCTNSLQLSSQHPQTYWLRSFFKCNSNPIFNQHTAAQFCLLFAYNFLSFMPLLTFCSYHFSLQPSIALSILANLL